MSDDGDVNAKGGFKNPPLLGVVSNKGDAATHDRQQHHHHQQQQALPYRAFSLLRAACDNCWRKKSKCTGEMPCGRCVRTGVRCSYSTKRRLGRPRMTRAGGEQEEGVGRSKKPKTSTRTVMMSNDRAAFSISPATGLAGLAESRFLSCFVENFVPMYPVVDEVSIRDGLMHAFTGLWNSKSLETLPGGEAMRGNALACTLFSSMAIGGLLLGCPPIAVADHMASARGRLEKFDGLSDTFAVSALILYAMSNALLPFAESQTQYRESMDKARAMSSRLPKDDPAVSAILAYRTIADGFGALSMAATYSANPIDVWGRHTDTTNLGVKTADGEAILKKAGEGAGATRPGGFVPTHHAHPVFVVTDAMFLSIRFLAGHGDGNLRLRHVHDFISSEINRLVVGRAGAIVLSLLAGLLVGVKTRLGISDGVLPAAELVSSLLRKCPGLARHCMGHSIHSSLAVFRLYGERAAYDDLRNTVSSSTDNCVPTFDEYQPGVPVCEVEVCTMHADILLRLPQRDGARPGAFGASPASSDNGNNPNSNSPNGNSSSSSSSGSFGSGEDEKIYIVPCGAEQEWSSVDYSSAPTLTPPPRPSPRPDAPHAAWCEDRCSRKPPQSSSATPIKTGKASAHGSPKQKELLLLSSSVKRTEGEDEAAVTDGGDAESSVFEEWGEGAVAGLEKNPLERAAAGDPNSSARCGGGLMTSRREVVGGNGGTVVVPSQSSLYSGFTAGSVGDLGANGSSATSVEKTRPGPAVVLREGAKYNQDDHQLRLLKGRGGRGGGGGLRRLRDLDTNVGMWSSSDPHASQPRSVSLESAPGQSAPGQPNLSDRYLPDDNSDWVAAQTGVASVGPDAAIYPGTGLQELWTWASGVVVDGGGGGAEWNALLPAVGGVFPDVGRHPHEHPQQWQRQVSRKNMGLLVGGQGRAQSTGATADVEITCSASAGTDAVANFGAPTTTPWVVDSPHNKVVSTGVGLTTPVHPPLGKSGPSPPPHTPPKPPPTIMSPPAWNMGQGTDSSMLFPFDSKQSLASGRLEISPSSQRPPSSSQITQGTGSGGTADGSRGGGGGGAPPACRRG